MNNNAYSAEFPKPGKDRIEIDTKGGSDNFHGGFSFTTRNSTFDARNPFAATNPPFSRSGYEVNLSGPVLKKKLYFFLDLDHENQQQVEPILAYLPTGLVNQQVLAPFTRDILLGRIDYQMTETHRVSAKYEFHQDVASNVGVGGFVLSQAGSTLFHHDYRIELSDQYVLSPNAVNNFRMALGSNYQQVSSQTNAPSVVVPGSFQEGGARMNDYTKEPRYEFQDTLSVVKGSLTLEAGGEANLHPSESYSADNFGGTYQFASLAAYEAGQSLLFIQNAGNPLTNTNQDDYAWFLQTEKQFSRFTLLAGVRHEFQSHLDHYGNLAPRLAAALALDKKTVLRVGAGVFYDRRRPIILKQVDRFNGVNEQQFVIENPAYPVIPSTIAAGDQSSTTYTIDPAMTLPRIYQSSATLERQFPGGATATADFTYQRGDHLLLTRNINAPLPVTLIRPDPALGNVDQVESTSMSKGNSLNVTLKSAPNKRYQLLRNTRCPIFATIPAPLSGLRRPVARCLLEWLRATCFRCRPITTICSRSGDPRTTIFGTASDWPLPFISPVASLWAD